MDINDVKAQARWELGLEAFEKAVEKEKKRISGKKKFFPWRLALINLNKGDKHE